MAEYIDRDALLESLPVAWDSAVDAIKSAPAADVVPVVRCKDCTKFRGTGKYYNGVPYGACYHWDYEPGASPNEVDGDDFCSCGTPKEG